MNIKHLFTSVSFALVTTMFINYFIIDKLFYKDTQEIKSGQAFNITPLEHINKPLLTEVNFFDEDTAFFQKNRAHLTEIETPLLRIKFSEKGGVVDAITTKKVQSHIEKPLEIIPSGSQGWLIADESGAPLLYHLLDTTHQNGIHTVTYQARNHLGVITKKYSVSDTAYTLDMELTIEPQGTFTPRIIFPAPQLQSERKDYDYALVNNGRKGIQRLKVAETADKAFASPSLCGAADRYFVNTLIKATPSFAQRCYFTTQADHLACIIEGAPITQPANWHLSWYCGPKEFEELQKSDPRLLELLDYSFLFFDISFITRPMLAGLKFFYGYVHNYGLAIMLLTIFLNLLLLPFTLRSERVLQGATDFSKKMHYLEQKYKHDRERLAQERAELVQKHGAFDTIGCVSFLLQMVFFLGLNKVLSSSIELYSAHFYWIKDLSVKDPYYILPIAVFLAIIIPAMNKGDIRQRATAFGMGLFFCGLMAQFSAGLVLFIFTNVATRAVLNAIRK